MTSRLQQAGAPRGGRPASAGPPPAPRRPPAGSGRPSPGEPAPPRAAGRGLLTFPPRGRCRRLPHWWEPPVVTPGWYYFCQSPGNARWIWTCWVSKARFPVHETPWAPEHPFLVYTATPARYVSFAKKQNFRRLTAHLSIDT